jgi:hypothetical protein
MREHSVHRLDYYEREIQPDTDRKGDAVAARRMVPVIMVVFVGHGT